MLEQPMLKNVPPGTTSDETATVSSPVNMHTPTVTDCPVNTTPVHNDLPQPQAAERIAPVFLWLRLSFPN
jgi:hypothetical protein